MGKVSPLFLLPGLALLFATFCIGPEPTLAQGMGEFQNKFIFNYNQIFANISRLSYGESCSWKHEKFRQRLLRTTMESVYSDAVNKLRRLKEAHQYIVRRRLQEEEVAFCDESKSLACDKHSKTCVCGDVYDQALLPKRNISASYEYLEGVCQLVAGAPCFSPASNISTEVCKDGLSCTKMFGADAGIGTPCPVEEPLLEFLYEKNMFEYVTNKIALLKQWIRGNVCKCM